METETADVSGGGAAGTNQDGADDAVAEPAAEAHTPGGSESGSATSTRPTATAGEGEVPAAFSRDRPSTRRERPGMPVTKLYLHWDRASDTFSVEGIGAISRREAVDILNHSTVTLTPVIDLAANPTYTGYVAPPRLKEHTASTPPPPAVGSGDRREAGTSSSPPAPPPASTPAHSIGSHTAPRSCGILRVTMPV